MTFPLFLCFFEGWSVTSSLKILFIFRRIFSCNYYSTTNCMELVVILFLYRKQETSDCELPTPPPVSVCIHT